MDDLQYPASRLFDRTCIALTKLILVNPIYKESEETFQPICSEIQNDCISDFLMYGLTLVNQCYVPEYIEVALQYEYEKTNKNELDEETLKTLVYLNAIFIKVVQKKDIDYFSLFLMRECTPETRNLITFMLHDGGLL